MKGDLRLLYFIMLVGTNTIRNIDSDMYEINWRVRSNGIDSAGVILCGFEKDFEIFSGAAPFRWHLTRHINIGV